MHERVANALRGSVPDDDIAISASPVGDIELLTISAQSERPVVAATVANATTVALRKFVKETGTLRDQIVLIDRATAPSVPVAPRPKLTIAIALVLAILFNCALALGREFFADRLPEIEEWEARFGRPVLATVPNLNLKVSSEVLTPARQLSDRPVTVMSTETLAGPTRWSIDGPEVRSSGV
jgi:capsular polysaccharide biosynthesis protein